MTSPNCSVTGESPTLLLLQGSFDGGRFTFFNLDIARHGFVAGHPQRDLVLSYGHWEFDGGSVLRQFAVDPDLRAHGRGAQHDGSTFFLAAEEFAQLAERTRALFRVRGL